KFFLFYTLQNFKGLITFRANSRKKFIELEEGQTVCNVEAIVALILILALIIRCRSYPRATVL
ncbi:MAG: hypothetical protein PHR17_09515, partial [Aminobacterium sp.]|nr:hypothetical protein [Aminobacterium sp.]